MRRLRIRTPEGVEFGLPLAGPFSRMLAVLIDLAVVAAVVSAVETLLVFVGLLAPGIFRAIVTLVGFVLTIAYPMAAEWWWRGQTLGKRVLRLRVIDAEGRRLTAAQVILRNLLRAVDMLPAFYLLGGAMVFFNREHRRLGDVAGRTAVISVEEVEQPDISGLMGTKYNSLAEHRHLAARLRQAVSPEVAGIALDAIVRRDEMTAPARLALFGDLAAHFKKLVAYPPEAVEQLSDEQYVRNAVFVLYRSREKQV